MIPALLSTYSLVAASALPIGVARLIILCESIDKSPDGPVILLRVVVDT